MTLSMFLCFMLGAVVGILGWILLEPPTKKITKKPDKLTITRTEVFDK